MQEITNAVRTVPEVAQAFLDAGMKTLTVTAADSRVAMAAWIFATLDQPAPANQATQEYRPAGIAGAVCRTRPHLGPGLPYFESASKALRDAILTYDSSGGRQGLNAIAANARKQDALTLWHLVVRSSGAGRDVAAQRFAALVPGADISGLKAGNSSSIDQAWNLLGLGGADWWRKWKQAWKD